MKTKIAERLDSLSKQYNIPKATIDKIISSYIEQCKWYLLNGNEVEIQGLAFIKPAKTGAFTSSTTAFMSKKIAETFTLAQHTVYNILVGYIDAIKEDILNENTAEIRSLVVFHPVRKSDGSLALHSNVSTNLKTSVGAVRVHTHKMFKYQLKTQVKQA